MSRIRQDAPLFLAGLILLLGLLPARIVGSVEPWLLVVVTPVVLVAPGLLIVRSFRLRDVLDLEAMTLAVGLSIAAVIVIGLGLHVVGRLDRSGWAIVYAGLVYLLLHEELSHLTRRNLLRIASRVRAYRPQASGLMLAGAALLAMASLVIARSGAEAHRLFAFTEFWSLPAHQQDLNLVEVGVRNMEKQPQGYTLDALVNGRVVSRRELPVLAHGETWHDLIPIPAPLVNARETGPHGPARVELHLHRVGEDQVVYRKVILSLPEVADPLAVDGTDAPDERDETTGAPRGPGTTARQQQTETNQHPAVRGQAKAEL